MDRINNSIKYGINDNFSVFKNQTGSSRPTVYTNYFYNAHGERVKKHTIKGGKIEVTIYTDGGLFETSYTKAVGGSIDTTRFYNTLKIIDDTSASHGTGNALIATIQVGKNVDDTTPAVKYNLSDHLGNSTVTLSESGLLINREEYYPFGETSFGGFAYKRYRYNGKEKDEESGLYEYGQRYYAPWLCRFVSVDPIAEDYPQLSSYNYAGNKPIISPDIEGLQGTEDAKHQGNKVTVLPVDKTTGNPVVTLDEVEVTADSQSNTIEIDRTDNSFFDIQPLQTDNIQSVSKPYFPAPTRTLTPRENYDIITRFGTSKEIGSILNDKNRSHEFKAKLYQDWVRNSGERFNDTPGGAAFREFLLFGMTLGLGSTSIVSRSARNIGYVSKGVRAAKTSTKLWPAASGGRTVINGIEYTTHALERMQPVGTIMKGATSYSHGIPPSVVENAIKFGKVTPGNTAAEVVRTFENVRVITNPAGTRVISVFKIGN